MLEEVPVTWYTNSREALLSEVLLLIQSPTCIQLEYDARVPGNACYNDLPTGLVENMGIQSEGREAFPLPVLRVPEVF